MFTFIHLGTRSIFSWEINFFWFISEIILFFYSIGWLIQFRCLWQFAYKVNSFEASRRWNKQKLNISKRSSQTVRRFSWLTQFLDQKRPRAGSSNQKLFNFPSGWPRSSIDFDANSIEVPIWSEIDGYDRWSWIEISLLVCVIHSSI